MLRQSLGLTMLSKARFYENLSLFGYLLDKKILSAGRLVKSQLGYSDVMASNKLNRVSEYLGSYHGASPIQNGDRNGSQTR